MFEPQLVHVIPAWHDRAFEPKRSTGGDGVKCSDGVGMRTFIQKLLHRGFILPNTQRVVDAIYGFHFDPKVNDRVACQKIVENATISLIEVR